MDKQLQAVIKNKGQSLVEVLVAVVVAIVALGALVTAATTSMKNAQFSRDQIQAEKYAQQGMEWVKLQKIKLPWATFIAKSTNNAAGNSYCINSLESTDYTLLTPGLCLSGSFITGTNFQRIFNMRTIQTASANEICGGKFNNSEPIQTFVTTSWTDSSGVHKSSKETCFTDWN